MISTGGALLNGQGVRLLEAPGSGVSSSLHPTKTASCRMILRVGSTASNGNKPGTDYGALNRMFFGSLNS